MTTLTIERPVELPGAAPVEAEPDTLVITVRQEHIDDGARGNGRHCPIAWAAIDAGLTNVFMGRAVLLARAGRYGCPEAEQFTYAFDHHQPVYPQQLTFRRIA